MRERVAAQMRDPAFLEETRREGELMAQHPENDAVDEWLEAMIDYDGWGAWDDNGFADPPDEGE